MEQTAQEETDEDTTQHQGNESSYTNGIKKAVPTPLTQKMILFIPMEILLSMEALIHCHQEMMEFTLIPM